MLEELNLLLQKARHELTGISETSALENWRIAYLGRKGAVAQMMERISQVPKEDRPAVGARLNAIKTELTQAFANKQTELNQEAAVRALEQERVDVTLPGRWPALGQRHIITRVLQEIEEVFLSLGFQVVEGPEVELDQYNFELLNIPKEHPARDMWDTFYVGQVGGEVLLRTHTSPMQARVMQKTRPPVRVIVPGKCYRYEAVDATHESQFYQVEGLAVDAGITMADLKGTLGVFARAIFGRNRQIRFRCDYFPFVEPGVDMSIDCHMCGGVGCRVCKGTGWIEIMGAGMVHPRVLEGVGYDSSRYTGFAFGMGPERIAMLKYGVDDIRLFYQNDLRFLRQFR